MQIIHHGGKETVTGSCHELRLGKKGILVDCGLFQGRDSRPMAIDFPLTHLQALLLTHSHIDHIGRIPWLLAAGFHQPIYCTPATAELLPLMLEDGLKLQLGLGQAQRTRILERLNKQIKPVNYGVWQRISRDLDNTYFRFTPAGHILGSAFIEVKLPNNEIVLFSGDLGPSNTPLLPDPVSPPRADYLLIESTYANKTHDNVQLRAQRLKDIINRSLQDGGTILIPAFSVGRTQELLFDIEQLIFSGEIDGNIPIILDSPMAQQVTKSYRKFKKLWGKEAKKRLDAQRPVSYTQIPSLCLGIFLN